MRASARRPGLIVLPLLALVAILQAAPTLAGLRLATAPRAKTASLPAPIVLEPLGMASIRRNGNSWTIDSQLLMEFIDPTHDRQVLMEFDLQGIPNPVPATTLGFWLRNTNPSGPGQLWLSTYDGDGAVTVSDYNLGVVNQILPSDDDWATFNLDVTSALQAAVTAGVRYIGFNLTNDTRDLFEVYASSQPPRLTVGGPTTFVPSITQVLPTDSVPVGSAGMTLTLRGSNFAPGAVIQWDGSGRTTTYVDPTYLSAEIPASDFADPRVAALTVFNPGPAGGASTPVPFTVRARLTWFVDDDAPADPGPGNPAVGDPSEDGSQAHPFDSIQEALERCFAGDIVQVMPGLFVEDLVPTYSGGSIVGSGPTATHIRSLSGQGLFAQRDLSGPFVPMLLSLSELALEGGAVTLQGHIDARFEDVSLHDVALVVQQRAYMPTTFVMNGATMTGGSVGMHAAGGGEFFSVTVRNLQAPATALYFMLADPAGGGSSLTLEDSDVAGLLFGNPSILSGGYAALQVSGVRFAAGGLHIRVPDDQGYSGIVEASWFEDGDLIVEYPYDYDGGVGGHFTAVRHNRFQDADLVFRPASSNFYLDAEANAFLGGGILIEWTRTLANAGFSSRLRAINNVFEGSSVGIGATYSSPAPIDCSFAPPFGDHRLEAWNNTIVGAGAGIRVQALDPPQCGDTISPVLTNNIVAFGGEGVSLSGFDPEWMTMAANDLFGNSASNYAGLADRTGWHGNISLDPQFVNAPAGDFHLAFGSPCIDAGRTLPGIVTTDFDGRPRPLRGRYEGNALTDIGAFEFELTAQPGPASGAGAAPGGSRVTDAEHDEEPLP